MLYTVVQTSHGVKEYDVHFAAAMMTAIPTLLVHVSAGRYFVRGLMMGMSNS